MIPILFSKAETSFLSNGIGRLADCISCEATEERNSLFEVEFKYPITGKWYQYIIENGGIIYTTHDEKKKPQPFDIYKWSAPIDGIVTFNARHISYRLLGITVEPFTASSCLSALQGIGTNSMQTNPFTFWTDKNVSAEFTLAAPASARSILAGNAGSILDVYGKGEYEYDKFTVKLHTNRGSNSGVTIRYGKNLADMTNTMDAGQVFNAVSPYWKGEDGTLVMLTEKYIAATGTAGDICVPLDLSGEFDEQPTEADLRARANKYLTDNEPWIPDNNLTVDFVQLWQTDDYKAYAPLERVSLCDTVSIYYPALGVANATAKVIKVVYDSLRDRYTKIELGKPQTTLSEAIVAPATEELQKEINAKPSYTEVANVVNDSIDVFSGENGGYLIIETDSNGQPQEILIMDTADKTTATNVWRFNQSGLAHSHNGYGGPYSDVALSADGKINASMILTGHLSADRIEGGTLNIGGLSNVDGTIQIKDAAGNIIGTIDKDGIDISTVDNYGNETEIVINDGAIYLYTNGDEKIAITKNLTQDGQGHWSLAAGTMRLKDENSYEALSMDAMYRRFYVWDGSGLNTVASYGDSIILGSAELTEAKLQQLLALI